MAHCIDKLPSDFIKYLIEKTDYYTEAYINANWNDETQSISDAEAESLINIGLFKVRLQKAVKEGVFAPHVQLKHD